MTSRPHRTDARRTCVGRKHTLRGIGLHPPTVSCGGMLQDCMNVQTVSTHPWLLTPVIAIVTVVMSFNFLGDALRDAADPYGE